MTVKFLSKLFFRLFLLLFSFVPILFQSCATKPEKDDMSVETVSPYHNHGDSATYVGKEACRDCHYQNYVSYHRTGMGNSFGRATRQKSDAIIGTDSIIYDSFSNYFYRPFWKDSVMFVTEFRLEGEDTVHQRTERVDYIVGSGHHTNSHIFTVNGYAFQIPFTYYTQQQLFDLPPGFEQGHNARFSRYLALECISCHNALPQLVMGSQNKYSHIPEGIDCERCHGPGSIHVRRTQSGILVDTSLVADFGIVNPARLSKSLQNDVCARCHLQGTMVLKEGKSFYDFKPGMSLTDVMDVFMPSYSGGPPTLIMASHIERMMESRCYLESNGDLSCIQCHNPHITVKETPRSVFNKVCTDCHSTAPESYHQTTTVAGSKLSDCVYCHLIQRDSRDIPHVIITDHKIAIPTNEVPGPQRFLGLVAVNNRQTDALTKGKGYLREYETYSSNPIYLDSAAYYLKPTTNKVKKAEFKAFSQYFFLVKNEKALLRLAKNNDHDRVLKELLTKMDYENQDAWTAYRIGQMLEQDNQLDLAWRYYKKAVTLAPLHAEMLNKMGGLLVEMDSISEARKLFAKVLIEHPRNERAWVNHGFCEMQLGQLPQAMKSYRQAIRLNPDNVQALVNLAGLMLQTHERKQAADYVARALRIAPQHAQALELQAVLQNR